ncbi:protein adenylyltransferase Fic [Peptococcus simiae]|uniref:protein adenylyltransferase n=1 Tax=Peptococcus simiae TaxID=1643805 RepID=A0ABW9H0U8_9FIRM
MDHKEELLSKKRSLELWDKGLYRNIEVGTFEGLSAIHKYLFQDVFPFAGQVRTENISKGNFRFAGALFLEANLKIIDTMPDATFEEIIDKYVEMNVAHPFREGNGRSMRIWLDLLLKERLGLCVDWAKVDKDQYLQAMERSPVNSLELYVLLQSALTDKVEDREVYMRGVQASYEYEGLSDIDIYEL